MEPDTSQWEGKRKGSAGEPVKDSETIWMIQNDSDGSTLAATEREVVTAGEATGLNQALVLRCSLVALQDSPKKSQKDSFQDISAVEVAGGASLPLVWGETGRTGLVWLAMAQTEEFSGYLG